MSRPVLLTDANVLFAAATRDLLVELAMAKVIALRWTETTHNEWTAALVRSRPDLGAQRIERTRQLLAAALPDAMVAGYEAMIPALELPDPDDCHVLAAAITGGCQLILTCNLVHFPANALAPYNLVAVHPDAFLARLCATDVGPVIVAAARIRARLAHPPLSATDYLSSLARRGLPLTAQALRSFEGQI